MQKPLCIVGRLGRKKKRALGARWEGEREKRVRLPPFPTSHRSQRASFSSIIPIFIGIPSGSLCRGERYFPTFDQTGCGKLVPRAFLLENESGEREKFWGEGGNKVFCYRVFFNYFCSVLLIPMSEKKNALALPFYESS